MSLVLLIKGRKSILKTKKIVFIEFTIIKPITISKLCRVYGVFLNWVCKVSYFVDLVIVLYQYQYMYNTSIFILYTVAKFKSFKKPI